MDVEVRIPIALRSYSAQAEIVVVEGETVIALIDNLNQMYEGFKEELVDDSGEIVPRFSIYLNDEDIRFIDGLASAIHDGDIVTIRPAGAGRPHL